MATTKMGAARDVTYMIDKHPEGITVRQLWERYSGLFADAAVYDEEEGVKLISKVLCAQSEQGLVNRKDGKNCFIYYPITTSHQAVEALPEPASKAEAILAASPVECQTEEQAMEVEAEANCEATPPMAQPEKPEPNVDILLANLEFAIESSLEYAIEVIRGIGLERHQTRQKQHLRDGQIHMAILREMAAALRPIRSDWAETATAVADHLKNN